MNKKVKYQTKQGKSKFSSVLFVGFLIFLATTVFFAIEAAASGAQLSSLEKEELELTRINSELSEKILEKSSLTKIEEKADEMGFVKSEEIFYIPNQKTFAKLP